MNLEQLRKTVAIAVVAVGIGKSTPVDAGMGKSIPEVNIAALSQHPCTYVGEEVRINGYMRKESQPRLLNPITSSEVANYISSFNLYPNSKPLNPDSSANYNPGSNGDIYGNRVNPHIKVIDIETVNPSVSIAPQARPDGWVSVTGDIDGNTFGCVLDTNNQVTSVPHR